MNKKREKKIPISAYLPESLNIRIRKYAEQNLKTVNASIIEAILFFLLCKERKVGCDEKIEGGK